MTTIRTADGKAVAEGDVVFNYYDGKWGTIVIGSVDDEGWFTVAQTDGTSACLNGERISSVQLGPWSGKDLPRP